MAFFDVSWLLILIILLVVLLVAAIYYFVVLKRQTSKKSMDKRTQDVYRYYRVADTLDYKQIETLPISHVMNDLSQSNQQFLKASETGYIGADFLLFETLNTIDTHMVCIPENPNLKFIYGVAGSDLLSSKNMLALILRQSGNSALVPTTYVIHVDEDMQRFQKEYRAGTPYIMKKNIQRQEGVKILSNYDEIMKQTNEYVVIQNLLQDPYVIGGRKINMRVYLLVVIDRNNKCKMYIYKDGFMYYTASMWKAGSFDPKVNITTGYIDRKVYEENPLTIQDFGKHIGKDAFDLFWNNLMSTMRKIKDSYVVRLTQENKSVTPKTERFLVYGVDVAPNKSLDCQIMEINKGPDLGYKDERDKAVKFNMMKAAFGIVGMMEPMDGFVQL